MRAIVHVLSLELFGQSLLLSEFPKRRDLRGVGMSDWDGYASGLARKLNYQNTYYHQEPKLDICEMDPKLEGVMDFIISSDVLEHVPPPVSIAFENLHRLLKPGGVLIFSVPYSKEPDTLEHFPQLNDYELLENGGARVLRNVTESGVEQIFENLVFHGGEGETLEMRVFSESALIREFQHAGFREIIIHKTPDFRHGIYWQYDWAIVMSARK
jgi:SAM-dependent methyltransferase